MISDAHLTADEFARTKHELPDGGRWHELHAGIPVLMQSPDDMHGNIVLNLSRALAQWFRDRDQQEVGYAAHGIGIKAETSPDTVYFPAMSYFDEGPQFEQSELIIATRVPKIVVDVASANDRRSEMRCRTLAYIRHGVQTVWVPDPTKKEVQVIQQSAHTQSLGAWQKLQCQLTLPGFEMEVGNIFGQPEWWK